MKRKINYVIAAAMVLTVVLFACRKEYEDFIFITEVTLTTVEGNTTATLDVNETLPLKVTILPEDATDKILTWTSSSNTVATVANGIVTAVSAGTVTITATTADGSGITATFVISVNVPASGITLNTNTLSMVEGGPPQTLTATVLPTNATNKTVTWESNDETIATVNNNGTVTPISEGATFITATTQDGKIAICAVIVSSSTIPVEGITLDESTITLTVNSSKQLTATLWPSDATNKTVSWSSNSVNASVDNGNVTALSPGTAIITATTQDGGFLARCTVTVNQQIIPVTGITLSSTPALTPIGNGRYSLSLNEGETRDLIATVAPPSASQDVHWESSNSTVASVNSEGRVTALNPGETSIIATSAQDGTKMAICILTVSSVVVNIEDVELDENTMTLEGSNTGTLTATVSPSNATVSKNVDWTSSDETVVKVINGVVTPVPPAIGNTGDRTATIYATSVADPTIMDECVVTVKYVATSGLELDPSSKTLNIGETLTPIVKFTPTNASIQTVTWSGTTAAAAVSGTGTIMALSTGSATITATAADGGETATCTITVP